MLQHKIVRMAMEFGTEGQAQASTFCLNGEDHTLGNSLRYVLNKDPRVAFCGYSVAHPSENRVNIRLQTTGDPAKDVFKDALQDMVAVCENVTNTFNTAVERFKSNEQSREVSATHISGVTHQSAGSTKS